MKKKPSKAKIPMPPNWEGGKNMPESMQILLEAPPWPEPHWVAGMAQKLLPRHEGEGIGPAEAWMNACDEAAAAFRIAFEAVRRQRHKQAKAPTDKLLIEHHIEPHLKAREREEGALSYERGCKLTMGEDKRARALKAFEELAGEQAALYHKQNGFTLEEALRWKLRSARESKKIFAEMKKSLAQVNGQDVAKTGQPAKKAGQKKRRPPKKGPGT